MDKDDWVQTRYRYRPLINRWSEVFGKENITLRTFDRVFLHNGDLIEDFIQATGIQPDSFTIPPVLNKSVSADILEFIRILNKHLPVYENNSYI